MTHLIDKDALVAEIERRIAEIDLDSIEDWRYKLQREHDIEVMKNIISIINILEVKDIDLEKEVELWYGEYAGNRRFDWNGFAKHFFELGLKAQKRE